MATDTPPGTFRPEALLEHRAWIENVARALVGNGADADDVAQQMWADVLARPPAAAPERARGWLRRVLRFKAIDAGRAAAVRARHEFAAARAERCDADPAEVVARAEMLDRVARAVLALDEPYRTTALLRWSEDLPARAIAERQGVPLDTVRTRLKRAVAQLRARLDAENEGNRERWRAALLPIALRAGRTTMRTTQVAASAGLALALLAGALWWAWEQGEPANATPAEDVAQAPAPPKPPRRDPPAPMPPRSRAATASQSVAAGAAGAAAAAPLPAPAPAAAPAEDPANPGAAPVAPGGATGEPERLATARSLGTSGDPATATLKVVVTDFGDRALDRVAMKVHSGIGRPEARVQDVPLPANGETEVRGLPPGSTGVWLDSGSLHRNVSLKLVAGQTTEVRIRFPSGATVTGVVRHATKGPLAKARLETGKIMRTSGEPPWVHDALRTEADEEGRYRMEDVPPGRHVISLHSDATMYVSALRDPLVVTGPGDLRRDIVVGVASIEGTVRDATTKAPVAGAKLSIIKDEVVAFAETDARGAYRLCEVPPGAYKLQVRHDGHVLRWIDATVNAEGPATRLDADLERAAILELHLADATGRPYVGGFVLGHESGSTGPLFTDENGVVRHDWLAAGPVTLSILAERGYQRLGGADVTLRPGVNVVKIEVTVPVVAADPSLGILVGRVTDSATGLPVPGARVAGQASRASTITDRDGRYRLTGLLIGVDDGRQVSVAKDGYGFLWTKSEALVPGKEVTFDVALTPGTSLRLRIRAADGSPVTAPVVLGLKPKEEGKGTRLGTSVTPDADGVAVFRQLLPGSYTISVAARDLGRASVEAEVGASELTLEFVLR